MQYVSASQGWLNFLIDSAGAQASAEDELIELEDMINEGALTDHEIDMWLEDKRSRPA